MIAIAAGWLVLLLATAPPLAPADRAQLMTASDGHANIDEAALYPLLRNALQWTPGEETDARVPDYARIDAAPAEARGELFLIEGVLAAWNTQPRWFSRPGPWDGPLQRWVIAVGPRHDRIIVVYLVAPTPQMQPALLHRLQPVRLAARFYKRWLDAEAGDNAKTFLTFVGRDARMVDRSMSDQSNPWLAPLMAVLLCGSIAWLLFRVLHLRHRFSLGGRAASAGFTIDPGNAKEPPEPRENPKPSESEHRKSSDGEMPLPNDPVAALEELQRPGKLEGNVEQPVANLSPLPFRGG